MNKLIKSLLIVALIITTTVPAWSQASTQGKEFWVSSTIVCSPSNGEGIEPYIAVSAENACTVTIQGGTGNAINITQPVAAGSWNEFGHNSVAEQTNPTAGLINVHMDASKWYPIDTKEPATVCNLAGQTNNYGLHITATENISVYVILGGLNSMDASNILPVTALGSEYYTQDFPAEAHNDKSWGTNEGNMVTMTTILAIEDNTKVDITPNGTTYDGHSSLYTITLNQGQTYYVMSQKEKQLAGTHIVARDDKKIAVYTGSPLTRLPNGVSARDALFEQPLPTEYWGTQFIVARSLGKNGNIVGITAMQNGTSLKIDGTKYTTLSEGQTYYIALQNAGDPQSNKPGTSKVDQTITADVIYIETSCPCAVYNYDTGNGYKGKGTDEIDSNHGGDPSSVWVSPIRQKINKITFGTCYTKKTKNHFLNVVTETATAQDTKLTAIYGASTMDQSSLLNWQPVPGNTKYSYARAEIGTESTEKYSVFRLENSRGFIATIYGNGSDESYAYSAGSAAVEQGVIVNGEIFSDGYISDSKFCINEEVSFDANAGNDDISRVDWNFGDGTKAFNGDAQTTHTYTTPGWYDVTAELYGHQVCTEELDQFLGSVSFTFRFVRQDTIVVDPMHKCLPVDTLLDNPAERARLLSEGDISYDPVENCFDTVHKHLVVWGEEREEILPDITANDSAFAFGKWFYSSEDYEDYIMNETGCETHRKCKIKVITCLKMDVETDAAKLHSCAGEQFALTYTKQKGDISESGARLIIVPASCPDPLSDDNDLCAPLVDKTITWSDMNHEAGGVGTIYLPTEDFKPGLYKAVLIVTDDNCLDADENPIQLTFVRTIAVDYPKDIIVHKLFNNVLAVLNAANNGGYQFVAFQWFRNGEPIPGATGAVYHSDEPLNNGDQYHVEVTDINGNTLPSCDKQISGMPDEPQIDDEPAAAPAQKLLQGNQMVIRLDGHIFNIFGQRVQ